MKALLKQAVKKLLWRYGLDVKKIAASNSDLGLACQLLEKSGATVVLDVGANEGQFALELLTVKPDLRIVSFEPLTAAHKALEGRARQYKNWIVARRMALGESKATLKINISQNSVSSSLLPMRDAHSDAAPDSGYIDQEDAEIATLADVASDYFPGTERLFLKIDTQGYEDKVINGAAGLFDRIVAIKLEVSFAQLYAGQLLAPDMINKITGLGYTLYGITNGFRNEQTGALLQADAYFIRSSQTP